MQDHEIEVDPAEAARAAGLRYVSDEEPGIRRRKCGKGFTYVGPDGDTVRSEALRARIAELVIPPAWKDVWICRHAHGHIQATGRDDEGRKQYLYHLLWRALRDAEKYRRLERFGPALPTLRQRLGRDVAGRGLALPRVVAGAVRLLDRAALRLGREEYTREHETFGLTTLRKQHIRLVDGRIRVSFDAKGGKERDVMLRDPPLARLIAALRRVPGDGLFQYRNGEATASPLRPEHVNDYLRSVFDTPITGKDFRTWAGSVAALLVLVDALDAEPERREEVVRQAVDAAADELGNLRSTARTFYVHPGLISAYREGELAGLVKEAAPPKGRRGYRAGEGLLVALLPHLDPEARPE